MDWNGVDWNELKERLSWTGLKKARAGLGWAKLGSAGWAELDLFWLVGLWLVKWCSDTQPSFALAYFY